MNFKEIIMKTGATLKEKSPEILVAFGIVSIGAGIVLACKATLDVDKQKEQLKGEIDEAVDRAKDKFDEIDEAVESDTLKDYHEDNAAKDKGVVYGQTAGTMIRTGAKVAKAYAPAAGCVVLGFTCILLSHKILRDRNATLLAAYTAIDTAFKAYRARVIKEGGKELDAKYLYGTKTEVREVKKINEETGLEEVTVETEEVIDYPLGSPYARIYDSEHCCGIANPDVNDSGYNKAHLRQMEQMANDKLKRQGYLFLNDVYKMLAMPESPEGQIVGWVKDNPNGDGYVDFGIDLCYTDPRFKNLIEPGTFRRKIVLDFNVDGPIIDKIGWNLKGKNDLSDEELKRIETWDKLATLNKDDPEYIEAENDRYARMNK